MNFEGPREFYSFLLKSVSDGGSTAMSILARFARDESELDLKGPTIGALLCWGEPGLSAIRELALANPTSKNVSQACKSLAVASSGSALDPTLLFIFDDPLVQKIDARLLVGDLRDAARGHLTELLFSLGTEDLLLPIGVAFAQLTRHSELAGELISAMSTRWLRVGPSAQKEYQRLLVDSPGDEPSFHGFFCRHPQFLDPMAVKVWSMPDFHGLLQPDFVIRRTDNSYLIVEIECPAKRIITKSRQLSAEAVHAEKQVLEYKQFLMERVGEAQKHFPSFRDADCLAIVGLEDQMSEEQKKALSNFNATRHKLRIVGFDWIAARAQAILQNVSRGNVELVSNYRLV